MSLDTCIPVMEQEEGFAGTVPHIALFPKELSLQDLTEWHNSFFFRADYKGQVCKSTSRSCFYYRHITGNKEDSVVYLIYASFLNSRVPAATLARVFCHHEGDRTDSKIPPLELTKSLKDAFCF